MGRHWEQEVKLWLRALGIDAQDCGNFTSKFDLCVGEKMIEVKSAHKTEQDNGNGTIRTRYIFNLNAKKDIPDDYFCICVCVGDFGQVDFFFIPGKEITGRTITITSAPEKYSGKYARFLNDHTHLVNWLETPDAPAQTRQTVTSAPAQTRQTVTSAPAQTRQTVTSARVCVSSWVGYLGGLVGFRWPYNVAMAQGP
jgi:hypothetical protein